MNKKGVYFQTKNINKYFFVPWINVGVIEKANFPLNKRGLRIEITGEYSTLLQNNNYVGNVKNENNRTYVYTITQLLNRDKLIQKFSRLRNNNL